MTMVQQPELYSGLCVLYIGAWRSRYDEIAVSGWMALSGARNVEEQDWGLAVSSIPMPDGEGWGLAFGRCASLMAHAGNGMLLFMTCTICQDQAFFTSRHLLYTCCQGAKCQQIPR